MAADYETGTASSPTNLLQTLVTWLTGQGWTQDRSAADGDGWWATLHKGSVYVNLRAANNEKIWKRDDDPDTDWDREAGYGIGLYLSTGYDGGEPWYNQPGRPSHVAVAGLPGYAIGAGMNLPSGSIAGYHFFDDGLDNIVVVVEKSPGLFVHMIWGPDMEATGTSEDVWYFSGSSWIYENTYQGISTDQPGQRKTAGPPMSHCQAYLMYSGTYLCSTAYLRVPSSVFADRWVGNGCDDDYRYGYTGRWSRCALMYWLDDQSNIADDEYPSYRHLNEYPPTEDETGYGRIHQSAFPGALLMPLHNFVWTEPAALWVPIGYPRTVFWCNAVGNGWTQGEVYQVGGVNYMVFPNFAVLKAA